MHLQPISPLGPDFTPEMQKQFDSFEWLVYRLHRSLGDTENVNRLVTDLASAGRYSWLQSRLSYQGRNLLMLSAKALPSTLWPSNTQCCCHFGLLHIQACMQNIVHDPVLTRQEICPVSPLSQALCKTEFADCRAAE